MSIINMFFVKMLYLQVNCPFLPFFCSFISSFSTAAGVSLNRYGTCENGLNGPAKIILVNGDGKEANWTDGRTEEEESGRTKWPKIGNRLDGWKNGEKRWERGRGWGMWMKMMLTMCNGK